jgi:pyrimidine operon attenuation protein/uracil phosphoribosyltransferase
VAGEGHQLATLLAEQLRAISPLQVHLVALQFEKTLPHQSAIHLSDPTLSIANQNVVIVDDVLNTGRTLAFALAPFLAVPIRKLQVAVLVNRGHRLYPVSADFVGYSLSTTFDDHIQVRLGAEHEQQGVFLVRSE